MSAPVIHLSHSGTPPLAWETVIESLPDWRLDPARHRRLVVVAPHPDDETLGVGGLIADAAVAGIDIVVLSLTDGEAAFEEDGLGERRHTELLEAMSCLVPSGSVHIVRCGFDDGGLARQRDHIEATLAQHVRGGDLVLAPLANDGHPDHDAAGEVAAKFDRDDVEVCFYPIWSWHWHQPSTSVIGVRGRRSVMTAAAATAKANALGCFVSQTTGDDPILPPHFTGRFDRSFEVLVCPR